MKKITAIIGLASVMALALFKAAAANYIPGGPGIYIDGTTNTTVNAGGTASAANAIAVSTTNYFNLSTQSGQQTDTNRWPAVCISSAYGSPARIQTFQSAFACGAANTGVWTERWAPSSDGAHWVTNPCPLVITHTCTGTTYTGDFTNYDTGSVPFWALFSQENTNTTTYITNNWKGGSGKF